MTTYADVWAVAEALFPDRRWSIDVSGWHRPVNHRLVRLSAPRPVNEVTWSFYADDNGSRGSVEAADADGLIAQIRALAVTDSPGNTPESVGTVELPHV